MTTAQEKAILRAAAEITRKKNRERRRRFAAQRKPGGKQHRGRERDGAHLAFIRRLPCACGCGAPAPSDAAHVRMAAPDRGKPYTGKQVKPSDRWTLPLSRRCHETQHSGSEAAFWSARGIDPIDLCERLYAVSGDEASALSLIQQGGRSNG